MKGGIYPTRYGYQVRFGKITKRFKKQELALAERFLTGLRYETDRGTFDIRDYRRDNPMGFENKVDEFIHSKRLIKGVKKYEQRLRYAVEAWGNRNVKHIGYKEISEFSTDLQEKGLSSKYRHDIISVLKTFFRWLWKTGDIRLDQIPNFPTVKFSMKYRNIITKDVQSEIIAEVGRISQHNARIYIGVKFLATYINLRPLELISVKEKDIDLDNSRILISESKTGQPKYCYLLEDDVALLRSMGKSFGELYFFRHIEGRGGNPPNTKFGKGHLYNYWKKACRNLGIDSVDLYGGCRHSSAVDLRKRHSPEAIKRATMTTTNEAFNRYLEVTGDELRGLYADTKTDNELITFPRQSENDKSLKIKGNDGARGET